jgi:hypothetical protein
MQVKSRFVFRIAITVLGSFPSMTQLCAQIEPPHPILTITGSGSGADSILSTYTETQFLDFVPQQSTRGPSSFGDAVVPGDTDWSWSTSSPNQITSTPSGTVFPNVNYPVQTQNVAVLSGKTVPIQYYLAAGSSTKKSLVFAVRDDRKRSQLKSFVNTLARAYMASGSSHATRNQAYARRIAVAYDHWAKFIPDYYLTKKNDPTFINVPSPSTFLMTADDQRMSNGNGMAHEWGTDELLPFDAIYDSPALAQLSTEKGYDVRQHILNGFFYNEGDFIVNKVPYSVATGTNLSGAYRVLSDVARVLGRPDYVTWLDGYMAETIRHNIRRDGVDGEGIGYSSGYVNENLTTALGIGAYFDIRPANTPQLIDVRDRVNSYVALLEYGQNQWHDIRLPDGQFPSFGDTGFAKTNARNAGQSWLLPAYGHVVMGTGSGTQSVQLNQNFSTDQNHQRADVTAFTLWALNTELLGNVRYANATAGRQFTEQILAHNAVTVDRSNITRSGVTSANLTLYEPGNSGLAVTELDGYRAYRNETSRYQRIMLLNTADLAHPYAVDLFRITAEPFTITCCTARFVSIKRASAAFRSWLIRRNIPCSIPARPGLSQRMITIAFLTMASGES